MSQQLNQPNHDGAIDPTAVSMGGVQAVIALIGVSMVLGIIWFFFWAKNGGFKWRKGDWEDYKSTVLRRKGPNGTTLSNATKSTILGGGSVVGDGYSDRDTNPYMDETSTQYTGTMTELSSSTAPIIKEKQSTYTGDKRSRRKKARQYPEMMTAKERKKQEMAEAPFEGGHDADVRAYMKERPARVGGINTTGDTMHYGTDYTDTEPSVTHTASQYRPAQVPTASHYSTPPSAPPSVPSHKKQPAREVRSSRRDFSYTIGGQQEQAQFSVASSQRSASPPPLRVPARATQQSNTKTYHHPLPNLRNEYNSSPAGIRGGGFRRGAESDLGE